MELSLRHGIRRYGFHGLAHRSMLHLYAQTASQSANALRVITLQLGAGCSATAIDRGRSVETSMGLTPLEGLVMATRSGDVDPALISYLAKRENVDSQTVDGWLNRRSGLFGLSGGISDMRYLVELADAGNDNASLAIEIFCHRVRKYIGAYLATLGGADAICFGGGIGENAWPVRKRILEGLEGIGLDYDHARNLCAIGGGRLVKDKSPIDARVISVNEEALITKDTVDCLGLAID
jgi:acetate kinase